MTLAFGLSSFASASSRAAPGTPEVSKHVEKGITSGAGPRTENAYETGLEAAGQSVVERKYIVQCAEWVGPRPGVSARSAR